MFKIIFARLRTIRLLVHKSKIICFIYSSSIFLLLHATSVYFTSFVVTLSTYPHTACPSRLMVPVLYISFPYKTVVLRVWIYLPVPHTLLPDCQWADYMFCKFSRLKPPKPHALLYLFLLPDTTHNI